MRIMSFDYDPVWQFFSFSGSLLVILYYGIHTERDEVEIYVFITSSSFSLAACLLAANLLEPLTFSVFIYILSFLFFLAAAVASVACLTFSLSHSFSIDPHIVSTLFLK